MTVILDRADIAREVRGLHGKLFGYVLRDGSWCPVPDYMVRE